MPKSASPGSKIYKGCLGIVLGLALALALLIGVFWWIMGPSWPRITEPHQIQLQRDAYQLFQPDYESEAAVASQQEHYYRDIPKASWPHSMSIIAHSVCIFGDKKNGLYVSIMTQTGGLSKTSCGFNIWPDTPQGPGRIEKYSVTRDH